MDRCIYKMIKSNENGEVKEVKYFSSKPLANEYEKQKDVYLVELSIEQAVERLNILVHNNSEVNY